MKKIFFLNLFLCIIVFVCNLKAEDVIKCQTNADCNADQFCEGGDKECFFERNICLPLDKGETKIYKEKSYLLSSSPMGWWAAQNWCKANNMQLVSLKSLGFKAPKEYCYHSDCLNDVGQNLSPGDWKELRDNIGNDWFWVNNLHGKCDSFRVAPLLELLAYSGRPVNLRALCE